MDPCIQHLLCWPYICIVCIQSNRPISLIQKCIGQIYTWIHHFVAEMCTHVHIYVKNRCILWDMGQVHCRISVMGLLCLQVPWHKDHHQETCWFSSWLLHLTFVFKKSVHNLHHKYSCCWSHPWLMIVLITKMKKIILLIRLYSCC